VHTLCLSERDITVIVRALAAAGEGDLRAELSSYLESAEGSQRDRGRQPHPRPSTATKSRSEFSMSVRIPGIANRSAVYLLGEQLMLPEGMDVRQWHSLDPAGNP